MTAGSLGSARHGTLPGSNLRWISFFISVLPKMNTSHARSGLFVQNQEAKDWRQRVVAVTGGHSPKAPFPRAKLTMIRLSTRRPDDDNLVQSMKHPRDALMRSSIGPGEKVTIRAGIIHDDKEPYLVQPPTVAWEKCKKGEEGIEVFVEELPAPDGFVYAPVLIIGPSSLAELRRMQLEWGRR